MKNYKLFPLSALFFIGLMNAQDVKPPFTRIKM